MKVAQQGKTSFQMKCSLQLTLYYNKNLFQRGVIKDLISIVETWFI